MVAVECCRLSGFLGEGPEFRQSDGPVLGGLSVRRGSGPITSPGSACGQDRPRPTYRMPPKISPPKFPRQNSPAKVPRQKFTANIPVNKIQHPRIQICVSLVAHSAPSQSGEGEFQLLLANINREVTEVGSLIVKKLFTLET